jgi:allantoinase
VRKTDTPSYQMTSSLIVRSERVVVPEGIRPAAIHIRDGRIIAVSSPDDRPAGIPVLDAGRHVVLPGLVDTHVHVNDPGRADWEGFDHATRAAAAGGVTTLVDMPLNSIPATTTVEGLQAKRSAAAGRTYVDVAFWGGVVPGNTHELEPLADAGVCGFKCFLAPSGVDEFPHVGEHDLREALPVLARRGLPLLVHAELPALLTDPAASRRDPRRYATWLDSRPPESERAAIDLIVRLARDAGARAHIVHLAAPDALPVLESARTAGLAVTVETCPHYLTFAAEDIPDGATAFKCAPPIRSREHRDALWSGLLRGDIDFVASDHSPAPPALKRLMEGDFVAAWGGIASLQIGLAAVWTGAAALDVPIERLADWLSARPARLAGLEETKGTIAAGRDADLVVWDPDAEAIVDPSALFHRHPVTPYAGMRLRGQVLITLVGGELVYEGGTFTSPPTGKLIRPPPRRSS